MAAYLHKQYGSLLAQTIWQLISTDNMAAYLHKQYGSLFAHTIWQLICKYGNMCSLLLHRQYAYLHSHTVFAQTIWQLICTNNMAANAYAIAMHTQYGSLICNKQYGSLFVQTIWLPYLHRQYGGHICTRLPIWQLI